jgi:hypothetical protein
MLLHASEGCLQALEAGWEVLEFGRSATTTQNPMDLSSDLLRDRVERSRRVLIHSVQDIGEWEGVDYSAK